MPRLYHTKSRTGCLRCRQRRVKCDEARPVCGGCSRHKVDCVFDRSPKTPSSDKGSPTSVSTPKSEPNGAKPPTPRSAVLLSDENRERRLRELHLLHCFMIDICPTFPGSHLPHIRRTWEIDVPRLAIDYEPLLNGIMALATLYITVNNMEGPIPVEQLKMHRAFYLEATLQEHRRAIGIMNREIADPASFTSVLLSLDAFASLRERPMRPYEPPLQWLHMCKGVMNVFRVAMDLVGDDPTARINIVSERSSSIYEPALIFRESNRAKFPYLMERLPDESEEDHEAYSATISFLGAIMTAKEEGQKLSMIARRVLVYPILFPTKFIELLGGHKPRALAIMAHFFAIAASCSSNWWIGTTPSREIHAIADQLGPQWDKYMSWPLSQVAVNK